MNTIDRAMALDKKYHNEGKGRKGSGVLVVSTGVD